MDLSAFFGKKNKKKKEKPEKEAKKPHKAAADVPKVVQGKATSKKDIVGTVIVKAPQESTSESVKVVNTQNAPSTSKQTTTLTFLERNDPEDTPLSDSIYQTARSGSLDESTENDDELLKSTKFGVGRHPSFAASKYSSGSSSEEDEIEIVVNPNLNGHYVPVHQRASVASREGKSSMSSSSGKSPASTRNAVAMQVRSSPLADAAKGKSIEHVPVAYSALDNFEQLETLGYGSFGCVHRVRNRLDKREYACKVLTKEKVVQKRQVAHLKNEKNILLSLNCPFIIQMHTSFVDDRNIYLMLEYCDGGELFQLLRRAGRLSVRSARFYAAEIVLALEYLHSFRIAFRDLKPENVLLTRKGHVKLCDFGFAKVVDDRTWTLCGTPEYLAPEVIMGIGHDSAVDWWSLGVLIFEMIAGYPPFYGDQPFEIYEKICDSSYRFPSNFEPLTRDIISRLLSPQKQLRLGVSGGVSGIKKHGFFAGIDWPLLSKLDLEPPSTPVPMPPRPESYFREVLPDFEQYSLKRPKNQPVDSTHDELFKEFDLSF